CLLCCVFGVYCQPSLIRLLAHLARAGLWGCQTVQTGAKPTIDVPRIGSDRPSGRASEHGAAAAVISSGLPLAAHGPGAALPIRAAAVAQSNYGWRANALGPELAPTTIHFQ